jgi:hypothetical protein
MLGNGSNTINTVGSLSLLLVIYKITCKPKPYASPYHITVDFVLVKNSQASDETFNGRLMHSDQVALIQMELFFQ